MAAQEKVSTHIHVVIDNAIDRLSVVSARFVANEDHVILKRLNYFNPSANKLLEDRKLVWNITKNWVFLCADKQDFHEEAPKELVVGIIAQQIGKVNLHLEILKSILIF